MSEHKLWHSRGYLPHFDSPNTVQAITFRLGDSLPVGLRLRILDCMTRDQKQKHFQEVEDLLDSGLGSCLLRDPPAATIVEHALLHFDGERYRIFAWAVMPNHVHVMIEMREGFPLDKVIHSWKSFTANTINKQLGRSGPLWQPDYFDRYIRDGEHYDIALQYIEYNPVKAKLAARPSDWPFSSASKR